MNLDFGGALAVLLCAATLILALAIAGMLVREMMQTARGRRPAQTASNWATALLSVAFAVGVAFGAAYYLSVIVDSLS